MRKHYHTPNELKGETVRLVEIPLLKYRRGLKSGAKFNTIRGTINDRMLDGVWYCIPETRLWGEDRVRQCIFSLRLWYERQGVMGEMVFLTSSIIDGIIFRWVKMDHDAFIAKVMYHRNRTGIRLKRKNEYRRTRGYEELASLPVDKLPEWMMREKRVAVPVIESDDRAFEIDETLVYRDGNGGVEIVYYRGRNSDGCVCWNGSENVTLPVNKLSRVGE